MRTARETLPHQDRALRKELSTQGSRSCNDGVWYASCDNTVAIALEPANCFFYFLRQQRLTLNRRWCQAVHWATPTLLSDFGLSLEVLLI